MTASSGMHRDGGTDHRPLRIDLLCGQYEAAWKSGDRPRIDALLADCPDSQRSVVLRKLLMLELTYRRREGESPALAEYVRRFPGEIQIVEQAFAAVQGLTGSVETSSDVTTDEHVEQNPVDSTCSFTLRSTSAEQATSELPARIGRYQVKRLLGTGGFGSVYLADDQALGRLVAIKVPRPDRLSEGHDVQAYLAEARMVAQLDHPYIVPVLDVGTLDDGRCFIVSKFIEGTSLAKRLAARRPTLDEAARWVATVADALHYAHGQKLIHRDIKPGNILLDSSDRPFVVDFGLALAEEGFGQAGPRAGTAAYMSPEQARGEGHLVDGRSDIFSLGVVLYELLTGERPFVGKTRRELLERIKTWEPRPPRQAHDQIPKELERICLKALAKRATDRYTTALDFGDDLRHFLAAAAHPAVDAAQYPSGARVARQREDSLVLPRGLRPYERSDAGFFLQLLPGPYDRDGLSERLRFWKHRIESTDLDPSFRVGLMYGPSGCGKSSLMKAGVLPRLTGNILTCYVEAAASGTERQLVRQLRQQLGESAEEAELPQLLQAIRLGHVTPSGGKVLIVLDQFEQWLHAHQNDQMPELCLALRHCDGRQLQCLILVRDDFWLAINRFMKQLEIPIVEGRNSSLVDLFDLEHARRTLLAIGQAYSAVPNDPAELTREQRSFVKEAVAELAEDERVSPVKLALFCEIVKHRDWRPSTLRTLGGVRGVGVAFLEQTFCAASAPLENRLHQRAALAVLRRLLPEDVVGIKGSTRSRADLLQASGYAQDADAFDELLRVLDQETRLLTPVEHHEDPEDQISANHPASEQYYQLSHDYLIGSLREWLARKQKETRAGRAELRLAERAAIWNAKPENKHLPKFWELLSIRYLTHRRDWTDTQRRMMDRATQHLALRGLVALVVLAVSMGGGIMTVRRIRAHQLVDSLTTAQVSAVPGIVNQLQWYRRAAEPRLRNLLQDETSADGQGMRYALALLPWDSGQVSGVLANMLRADAETFWIALQAVASHKDRIIRPLWNCLRDQDQEPRVRLRAACVLASCDPPRSREDLPNWTPYLDFLAEEQVNEIVRSPDKYQVWEEAMRPLGSLLAQPRTAIHLAADRSELDRFWVANILADDYSQRDPNLLVDLLLDTEVRHFEVVLQTAERFPSLVGVFRQRLQSTLPNSPDEDEKDRYARRQAKAAIAVIRLDGAAAVWPYLQQRPDSRLRSYLIHHFADYHVDPRLLLERLQNEQDMSARRALVLALGEYSQEMLPPITRDRLMPFVVSLIRGCPDPGLHSAAEWLLRQWGQADLVREIRSQIAAATEPSDRSWYVNTQGQKMIVLGPDEFLMGSPKEEPHHKDSERLHRRRIDRVFSICSEPVTVEQFDRFFQEFKGCSLEDFLQSKSNAGFRLAKYAPSTECPQTHVTWDLAASYCNWLTAQENLPADQCCYVPAQSGMRPTPDLLSGAGYRLPTEAEWEYACRAGSQTGRYYGQDDTLLSRYAWFADNSSDHTWPVGRLKPNDFGLFDTLGNTWEWCNDLFRDYPTGEVVTDGLHLGDDDDRLDRVNRGGTFVTGPIYIRSATRNFDPASKLNANYGFRVVRSHPLVAKGTVNRSGSED